jgi:asparagine synthase (glutamine-hydrolysing)
VGLAHRRLSIIDLSPAGHQPMHDERLGLTIAFNGEIYNFLELRAELEQCGYSFRSRSDTEVLLAAYHAWGADCLQRLNGMFAFALHDARHQRIFLARDRAGEKPLFYRIANGTLQFASELKALRPAPGAPARIDRDALDCYLAIGYVPGERCILQGYRKLPPSHGLSFELQSGATSVWRYWQPPQPAPPGATDEPGLLDELEVLLQGAVQRQLVADVPVGVLLSGGVDSSLVTAMAVRTSSQVKTFTIRFPGHGAMDETEHARLIAGHFGTRHTELVAEPASTALLHRLARQFDEPIVDSSMIPTFLVSQLVRQHCTVALGGDGGDELFGGYLHYSRMLWLQKRFGPVPHALRGAVASLAERGLPLGLKGRNWLMSLGVDLHGLPWIANYFDTTARRRLMAPGTGWQPVAESIREERIPGDPDLLQRATRMDFANYLPEDILVKVDRASMLASLEVRAPLLDRHIIEFAFGKVPSHLKATLSERKILLKRLAARVLPSGFDLRRKQGFSIPLDAWLRTGPFQALFNEVLRDPGCAFDRPFIEGLLKRQQRGQRNGERLFALVLFELWRREQSLTL